MIENWQYYLLAIPLYKIISNIVNYYRVNAIYSDYIDWIESHTKYKELVEQRPLLKKLVKESGITEPYLPTVQKIGYGQAASFSTSVIENFPSIFTDFATIGNDVLLQLRGVFKARIFETFNPIYWIDLILYLPQNLLIFCGISSDNIFSKFTQICWWIISVIFALAIQLYPDLCRHLLELVYLKFQ